MAYSLKKKVNGLLYLFPLFLIVVFSLLSCRTIKVFPEIGNEPSLKCKTCNGTGHISVCPKCLGTGRALHNRSGGPDWLVGICPLCHGNKSAIKTCPTCHGTGTASNDSM